jgi:subtilisin family serine protease
VTTAVTGALAAGALAFANPAVAHVESDARSPAGAPSTQVGRFSDLSTPALWKQLEPSHGAAVVGLKAADERGGVRHGEILMDKRQQAAAVSAVRRVTGVSVLSVDTRRPTLHVRLANQAALDKLRHSANVEYVEPGTFHAQVMSSGCTGNAGNSNPAGGDSYAGGYDMIAPNDMLPRNFNASRLQDAWSRGAAGQGVKVAVLDTGIFSTQDQLGHQFATGWSGGRTIEHVNVSGDADPADICNHGTRMASTVAAPRDGINMVGAAWRANLLDVKVGNDVFVDAWETDAVVRGIREAAARGARVIVMAFGTGSWEYDNIKQEIWDKYYNQGILFVGAAGNHYCLEGIIFPAKMPEVVAATGADYAGNLHPDTCGGPEVDMAAVVSDAFAAGRYAHNIITMGGSSEATAIVGATAALIWSQYPTWTRDQVLNRLLASGQSGSRYGGVGFGIVNAYRAVGGFAALWIDGPTTIEPYTAYTLTANPTGDGPFVYQWSTGATTRSINLTSGAAGTAQTVSVTVTDTRENKSLTKSIRVTAKDDTTCTYKLCP